MVSKQAGGGKGRKERDVEGPLGDAWPKAVDVVGGHETPRPSRGPSAAVIGLAPRPELPMSHGALPHASRGPRVSTVDLGGPARPRAVSGRSYALTMADPDEGLRHRGLPNDVRGQVGRRDGVEEGREDRDEQGEHGGTLPKALHGPKWSKGDTFGYNVLVLFPHVIPKGVPSTFGRRTRGHLFLIRKPGHGAGSWSWSRAVG